ncbi:hypothetical protein BDV06DRAFT_192048 [Aspergillus oleicola]
MVVCNFFLQNRCRYGNRCKNEHPGQQQQQQLTSGNRFGALSSGGGSGFGSRASSGQSQQFKQEPANYGLTTDDIKADLVAGKGRPDWIFSCYGPGKDAPKQLFGGPQRERSFEELRLRHYEAAATGNPGPAIQEAESMYSEAVNQMEVILKNLNEAVRYIVDGGKEHPNRIDICKGEPGPGAGQTPAFSSKPAFAAPGFTPQPSNQSGFGQPAFGQPSQPSAFGQPSALGQTAGSGFGQPSALGGSSGFGKPAFGQPSQPSFGQPSLGQTAFGQPSALGASPFGQTSGTASPFSQIPAPSTGTSQPSGFSQGTSGFGQQSSTATTSGFGTPAQQPNPFSQPSTTSFGQPAQQAPNPFGAPAQQQVSTPFGQQQSGGAGATTTTDTSTTVGIGPPPVLKVENDLMPIPPLNGQSEYNGPPIPNTKLRQLTRWKGQPVQYINDAPCYLHPQDGKTWVRIFFPHGPPLKSSVQDAQAEPEKYTPEVAAQYEFFVQNGSFKDGLIPSVPPKTEWVSFDF